VELLAENTRECCDLVKVGLSHYGPDGAFYLGPGFAGGADTVGLRIYVGETKPAALDAETRAAIDATP
jgi:hypothetical protein